MSVSRRSFLRLAGGLGLVGATAGLHLVDLGPRPQTGSLLRSGRPLPRPFAVPLPVPAVARPAESTGDVDRYEIVQREADAEVLPGTTTRVWGYDGTFPGPTIRARRGRPVEVRFRNELAVPTAVHLHGGHTPADSDGYPIDLIPGPRRHLRRTRHPAADNGNRTGLRSRIRRPDRHDGRPLGARPRAHPRPRTPHVVAQLAIPSGGRVGPEASPAWHAGLFGSATAGVCVNTAEPDTPAGAIGHLA